LNEIDHLRVRYDLVELAGPVGARPGSRRER
jgi:hypothetical protein